MILSIHSIETGKFKLDGGAMFGVVPKTMWSKLNPPDETNMCTWAMRCLLIRTETRNILIDTGMGTKQDEKFRSFFHPHGSDDLISSLSKLGIQKEAITDVLLTHLHFDHCGGAVSKKPSGELVPSFPQAKYWSNALHWQWAKSPNDREKASFLKENFIPLEEQGLVEFINISSHDHSWLEGISLRFVYGHTEAMMLAFIPFQDKTYVYCADLLPSSYHISIPFIMAYDIRPLISLEEKNRLLQEAVEFGHILILEHDPDHAACTVKKNDQGRIILDQYRDL